MGEKKAQEPCKPDRSRCYLHLASDAEEVLLEQLRAKAPAAVAAAGHATLWGVDLSPASLAFDDAGVVLFKFLRSADLDTEVAAARLESTLRFRKEQGIDDLATKDLGSQFEGHDTILGTDTDGRPVMISRYGQMDNDKVFGDAEAFVQYRLKVMEQAVSRLSFAMGEPEDLCQIHDYSGVPLLFKTSEVKGAIAAMSKVFGDHYPEMKGKTIFVNFPTAFSKVFQAFAVFLPERTRKKFMIFGESDQALLFQHLRPETVPEALGGMLRADGLVLGPCTRVEVSAGAEEEVILQEVSGPAEVDWQLRVCASQVAYELVFVPADGSDEVKVRAEGPGERLSAEDGVVAGRYTAAQAGCLRCRFRNDQRAWLLQSSRLCLCRGWIAA